MSRTVKSARGRIIDLGALASQNEKTRAVGNVPMNARGDRLDSKGNIRKKVEDIARITQTVKTPPREAAMSDPIPIINETPQKSEPVQEPVVEEPVVEEQQPEAISKITRTRDDGSKYVEIEYDDGSIETVEVKE